MHRPMNHKGSPLPMTQAVDQLTVEIDGQKVFPGHLRPVGTVAIEQETIVGAVDHGAEMVVDPFVEAIERGSTECGGQFQLLLPELLRAWG